MVKIKNTKILQRYWTILTLIHCWEVSTITLEKCLSVSTKIEHVYTICLNSNPRYITRRHAYTCIAKTCTRMLIAPLFIMTPNWKQSKRPSTGEWMNTWRHICIVEYYIQWLTKYHHTKNGGSHKYHVGGKKPDRKSTDCMFPCMQISKAGKTYMGSIREDYLTGGP